MSADTIDHEYRQNALVALEKIGLPTKRTEVWRGGDVSIFKKNMLPPAQRLLEHVLTQDYIFDDLDAINLVFINGYYHEALSDALPYGVQYTSLSEAVEKKDSILSMIGKIKSPHDQATVAMNAVNARDGALIKVSHGVKLDRPIRLIFKNPVSGYTAYGRVLIVADNYSDAEFIAVHDTDMGSYENHVTEIYIKDQAKVNYLKTVTAQDAHFGAVSADIFQYGNLNLGYYLKGAGLLRQETVVNLRGQGANVNIGAASYVTQQRINDHLSVVSHMMPHCTSSQVFKNLADHKARSVTRAKTYVAQNAQKTDGRQMLQALLLSEQASSYAKPELEIYADDVKCAHGSTVGQLDKDAMFYLQSRGLSYMAAKALLTRAFISEALEDIIDDVYLEAVLKDFDDLMQADKS